MYERFKTYAPYLAYAGLLALAAGLIALLLGGQLTTQVEALLVLGGALLGLFILARPAQVRTAVTGRTARYGSNALVMSLAFIGILALLNFLGGRHHRRFDLTASKQFSLSPQTVQVLQHLQEPVKVTAFFTQGYWNRQEVEDRLKEYTYHTDKLSYEFIDPDLKPALARQYGLSRDGSLIFQRGDRRQEIYGTDEQAITSAILKVSQEQTRGVYFLTGHKERDIEGSEQPGYSQMRSALEKDNYRVATLNLATITDTLPADLAVLVVAAPQIPLAPEEQARLAAYLEGGGKVLVMQDPGRPDALGDVLARWGVHLREDVIIDPVNSFFGDVASPLVSRYHFHQITKDLGGLTTFFPLARSVEQLDTRPPTVTVTSLIATSSEAWGETDLQSREARYEAGKDVKGPLDIAVAVEVGETSAGGSDEEGKPQTRLVVFGDSDFASNGVLGSVRGAFGNADLFLNAVNWLTEEEELISIRPRPPEQRIIFLTPPQVRLIFFSSVIFLPAVVLILGGVVWWRRR